MREKTVGVLLLLFLIMFLSINRSSVAMAETGMDTKVAECITEMLQIIDQKGKENPRFLMSSNPYAYVKDNNGYNNLVNLGPKSLPAIQKLIESGYYQYYLAIAAEEILQVDLKESFYRWATADEFAKTFREFLGQVPTKVNEIVNSNEAISEKNKSISKLGIFAAPYVAEHIKNGKIEFNTSLQNLLNEHNNKITETTELLSKIEPDSCINLENDKIGELKQLVEILTEPIVDSNISISGKQSEIQNSNLTINHPQYAIRPSSWYDTYSWTWHIIAPATPIYNCLAYAVGYTDRQFWPWGHDLPTHEQVISILRERGYDPVDGFTPRIIAYGNSNTIVHFSKYVSTSECIAKWGDAELIKHYSTNPYFEYDPDDSSKADQYGYQQFVLWK